MKMPAKGVNTRRLPLQAKNKMVKGVLVWPVSGCLNKAPVIPRSSASIGARKIPYKNTIANSTPAAGEVKAIAAASTRAGGMHMSIKTELRKGVPL